MAGGQVVYRLKHPFRNGTAQVLFSPEGFIARLAALVPRPGFNLTRYRGVFAPSACRTRPGSSVRPRCVVRRGEVGVLH